MGKTSEKRMDSSAASGASSNVLPFYSDRKGKAYREFSNFFREMPPYEFTLPDYARLDGSPSTVIVEFSEKAIMLVKAGLFKDRESFRQILQAVDPSTAKKLGRGVRNFDEDVWEKHLEQTAFQCVLQKFASSASLRKLLLQTGDKILAEAAPNDTIWGIGLPTTDDRAHDPKRWCGRNVLGYALMAARSRLRGDTKEDETTSVVSTSPGSTTFGAAPAAAEEEEAAMSDRGASESSASASAAAGRKGKRWARSKTASKEEGAEEQILNCIVR